MAAIAPPKSPGDAMALAAPVPSLGRKTALCPDEHRRIVGAVKMALSGI